VAVDKNVAVDVVMNVDVTVSGRAEWLLPPTGKNYDALSTDREGNYDALSIDREGFMTLLASSENSPNFHYYFLTLY
jgi:hypothetical protein